MKRIMVATDGSPSAVEAERFGIELAAEHDTELVFVHSVPEVDVLPSSTFGMGGAFPHEPDEHDVELLAEAADRAADKGMIATTALVRGESVQAIVEYADSHDLDLVVVGSRGHGALTGTLLGSVSLALLHGLHRPIAIVRAPEPAPDAPQEASVVTRS